MCTKIRIKGYETSGVEFESEPEPAGVVRCDDGNETATPPATTMATTTTTSTTQTKTKWLQMPPRRG